MFDNSKLTIRQRYELNKSIRTYTGIEGIDYIECKICNKRGLYIDPRHLKTWHNITLEEYKNLYPDTITVSEKKKKSQARPGNKVNLGRKFSKEHREKISIAQRGENNCFYGKKHTVEILDKIKKTKIQKYGKEACNKYEYDFVKFEIEKEGYSLLSTKYVRCSEKLEIKCDKGHIYNTRFDVWIRGYRCPCCGTGRSKAELEVFEFIKQYFPNVESGNRNLISPYEIDVVIPDKKIAIEYCGLYWHSDEIQPDKSYHLNKLNLCNSVGYNLITIFEDEWIHKQDIVKSRLLSMLGITGSKKLNARDCYIEEIGSKIKNNFLEKNHLQGKDNSLIKLGLFNNDELVSVMTFSKPSIAKGMHNTTEGLYELNRFCSKYNVRGAASKLLKYFITNYNPLEIYSYADRRWSTGNLYNKLGFEFVGYTSPNYWYISNNRRIHRFNFRKNRLPGIFENVDMNKTEVEIMLENGYRRIWDCGNIKYNLVL